MLLLCSSGPSVGRLSAFAQSDVVFERAWEHADGVFLPHSCLLAKQEKHRDHGAPGEQEQSSPKRSSESIDGGSQQVASQSVARCPQESSQRIAPEEAGPT